MDDDFDQLREGLDDRHQCWSCQAEFEEGEGISIDESGLEQCCRKCWKQITPATRLWLGLFFRMAPVGGVGLRELFANAIREWPFIQDIGRRMDSDN